MVEDTKTAEKSVCSIKTVAAHQLAFTQKRKKVTYSKVFFPEVLILAFASSGLMVLLTCELSNDIGF